jgi:hypothetical protein
MALMSRFDVAGVGALFASKDCGFGDLVEGKEWAHFF